jgi:hypothetical protein
MPIALEAGSKRTFAVALDHPGLSRAGRDEAAAIDALLAAAPRYAAVLRAAGLRAFPTPAEVEVVERLRGDATTDFGAPGIAPAVDAEPVGAADLRRLAAILRASWAAFETAADAAEGVALATGPRGGGRSLDAIRDHVEGADGGYLRSLGGTTTGLASVDELHDAFIDALGARARGELPDVGPRGGARWTARYAVRRSAWHALDHAWEIEDRAGGT